MGAESDLPAIGRAWSGLAAPFVRQIDAFVAQRWLDLNRTLFVLHARENYSRNLELLNDVLAQTELAKKYWIVGGLLIGWAREQALLGWDFWDADFAFLMQDRALFESAGRNLIMHGFRFDRHWSNNAGIRTQSVFFKDNAKFEFWEMTRAEDVMQYSMYGTWNGVLCEAQCQIPNHGIEPINFLNRIWQKPDNHETFLTQVYGDWHVPQPKFSYMQDQHDIVAKYPWHGRCSNKFDD